MITNLNNSLQGWIDKLNQGWSKKVAVAALGAAVSFGVMSPSTTHASVNGSGVTQLEFVKFLTQLTGVSGQFNANSTAADYINWAKTQGLNPSTGWQPGAVLDKQSLALLLVQLYGLNPHKYGGDYIRILQREGIELPADNNPTRQELVSVFDDPLGKMPHFGPSQHKPKHPNNGWGNGDQPPPPHNPNGNPHFTKPHQNGHSGDGNNGNGNGNFNHP